ncbi:hypothetical protein [Psychromonas aquimarina]|uniref:hypothetical protein n=1 Tax=Psychromonas aquimarina TaxID=444919 RepID=UPI0003FBDFBF|nr:hypothetical protein [Psychromonas aquimarina]
MTFQTIINTILPYCQIHKYPAKHVLKDECDNKFCFLLKGSAYSLIKNNRKNNKAKELILLDFNPGDFFGELIFPGETKIQIFDAYVKSKGICEVAEISYHKLQYIMMSYPAFLMYLSSQIVIRMKHHNAILNSRVRPQTVRVELLLNVLVKGPDTIPHPDGMQIKISRKEIGLRLNIGALTVSKALHLLREQKIIMFKDASHNIVLLGAKLGEASCKGSVMY